MTTTRDALFQSQWIFSYTGLEADVATYQTEKELVTCKYLPALAFAAPQVQGGQASRIRLHKLCVFLFGRIVIL